MDQDNKTASLDDSNDEESEIHNLWLQTVSKQNFPQLNRSSCHKYPVNQLLFFGGIH